jgi:hypothetical protein
MFTIVLPIKPKFNKPCNTITGAHEEADETLNMKIPSFWFTAHMVQQKITETEFLPHALHRDVAAMNVSCISRNVYSSFSCFNV